MNAAKEQALEVMNELHKSIPYSDYCAVMDGLQQIELLRDRDEELEELWAKFGDIPMNPKTECIEKPFMGWGAGIHREEIWHWFDARHSKGVAYLLGFNDRRLNEHVKLDALCNDCESRHCAYNSDGCCRFALVYDRPPEITEELGCVESVYQ